MIDLGYRFIKDLADLPFVEQIWLFGSRARGDNLERADIDLAIYCPHASDADWLMVLDIVENADTLLKIDCVRLDELKDSSKFKDNIARDGVQLYEKP